MKYSEQWISNIKNSVFMALDKFQTFKSSQFRFFKEKNTKVDIYLIYQK